MSEALAMPCHLKGIAKTWYISLSSHTQQSMNLLQSAFLNRFKSSNNVSISVLTISKKQDETTEDYFSRFYRVMSFERDSETASDFYGNERP